MSDMLQTIVPKSDQLNADDLIGDRKITITITKVKLSPGEQQSVSISFEGDNGKPWKPCLSMRRVLVSIWGKDSANYIGKKVTLYCDPKVVFGGKEVGGIRISHMSNLDAPRTLALTASKANRKPFTVLPLVEDSFDPAVKAAGDVASGKGVVAYRTWLETLEPSVKHTVRCFHKEWSAKAKTHDEAILNN